MLFDSLLAALPQHQREMLEYQFNELAIEQAAALLPNHHCVRGTLVVDETCSLGYGVVLKGTPLNCRGELHATVSSLPGSFWNEADGEWYEVLGWGVNPAEAWAQALLNSKN